MLELSNKKKIRTFFLVILFLILFGGCGYFGYEFFKRKECNNIKCEPCSEEKNDTIDNILESSEVSVYEGANTISEYWANEGDKFKVVLPQINGNSEVINKINKDIIEKVISKSLTPFADASDKKSERPNSYNVSYEYKRENDILYIALTFKLSPWNSSGNGIFVYNYTYDIKNDKELTLLEALISLGKTEDELVMVDSWCNTDRKCKKSDLPEYITNKNGVYYYLENGKFKFNYLNN